LDDKARERRREIEYWKLVWSGSFCQKEKGEKAHTNCPFCHSDLALREEERGEKRDLLEEHVVGRGRGEKEKGGRGEHARFHNLLLQEFVSGFMDTTFSFYSSYWRKKCDLNCPPQSRKGKETVPLEKS